MDRCDWGPAARLARGCARWRPWLADCLTECSNECSGLKGRRRACGQRWMRQYEALHGCLSFFVSGDARGLHADGGGRAVPSCPSPPSPLGSILGKWTGWRHPCLAPWTKVQHRPDINYQSQVVQNLSLPSACKLSVCTSEDEVCAVVPEMKFSGPSPFQLETDFGRPRIQPESGLPRLLAQFVWKYVGSAIGS